MEEHPFQVAGPAMKKVQRCLIAAEQRITIYSLTSTGIWMAFAV